MYVRDVYMWHVYMSVCVYVCMCVWVYMCMGVCVYGFISKGNSIIIKLFLTHLENNKCIIRENKTSSLAGVIILHCNVIICNIIT